MSINLIEPLFTLALIVNTTSAPQPKIQCLVTDQPEPITIEYKTTNHTVIKKEPSPLGTNCVAYARSKKELPQGMGTLSQKLSHIRSQEPARGKIGVTAEGPVGHLIYVEDVRGDEILISEGNFISGYITYRLVQKQKIKGYL